MNVRYFLMSVFFFLFVVTIVTAQEKNISAKRQYSSQQIYLSVATPPTVVTDIAINITQTSAVLKGTVNPNGQATQAQFEYGLTTAYGSTTPLRSVGSGTSNVNFADTAVGLTPNTLYHFRLKATNGSGTVTGSDKTFTTLPNPPLVLIEDADNITLTSAMAHAKVNPQGAATSVFFQWGIDSTVLGVTSTQSVGSGTSLVSVGALLQPLASNTTYYVIAVATNAGGTSDSDTAFFTTLAEEKEYLPDAYTVGLFHLNEFNRTEIEDYSDNHNWGTAANAASISGKFGYARSFDNVTSVIIFPHISDYNFDGDFTLEAWVKPELFGINTLVVIAKGNPEFNNEAYRLSVLNTGSIEFIINTNGGLSGRYITSTDDSVVSDGQWQHIAATYNDSLSEVKIYYNGKLMEVTHSGTVGPPFTSVAPLTVGLAEGAVHSKKDNLFFCGIDEVRLSNKMRKPREFNLSASISGIKFWDINGNGIYDSTEPGLQGWEILLRKLSNVASSSGIVDTAVTDSTGYYSFTNLSPGGYIVGEVHQENWVQTAPPGEVYRIIISGGEQYTDLNFGNLEACRYLGGDPINPSNWSCGHLPSSDEPIIIRGNSFDLNDSIINLFGCFHSFQVENGGNVSYSPILSSLCIKHKLRIDDNSTFAVQALTSKSAGAPAQIYLEGSLINNGTLLPGTSAFIFQGNKPKVIASNVHIDESSGSLIKRKTSLTLSGNNFYDLIINGENTSSVGNITVNNQLLLNYDLDPEPDDTIAINNSNPSSLSGTGKIPDGSIKRMIQQGSTAPYRFSHVDNYLQFENTGDYPDSIIFTTVPDSTPRSFSELKWEVVLGTGHTRDTANNTITVSGLSKFSKWTMGTSGSGINKRTFGQMLDGKPLVSRAYNISASGGEGFEGTLQLRYDDNEAVNVPEDSLLLLRGPYFVGAVNSRWNMLSLPVVPEENDVDVLFPSRSSQAFAFLPGSGYVAQNQLTFGTGYWLKFPDNDTVTMIGEDRETNNVIVEAGWNMIGGLTYPFPVSSVTALGTTLASGFYGYNNGYFLTDSLKPLRGYWIKVTADGVLSFDASLAKSAASPSQMLKGLNTLTLRDANGNKQILYFGSAKNLDPNFFEMPPLPPTGIFDARFSSGRMLELCDEKVSREIPVQLTSGAAPLTISWEIIGTKNAVLIVGNKEIELSANGSVKIPDPNTPITLLLNPVLGTDVPKEFALYQNYPNPFNPSTSIRFDIPSDAVVTLKVYNILGQEVATVVDNKAYKAGRYIEQFNNSNLASGVYFYRISIVGQNDILSYTSVKKMVLIR
jgi:hypothetical protein